MEAFSLSVWSIDEMRSEKKNEIISASLGIENCACKLYRPYLYGSGALILTERKCLHQIQCTVPCACLNREFLCIHVFAWRRIVVPKLGLKIPTPLPMLCGLKIEPRSALATVPLATSITMELYLMFRKSVCLDCSLVYFLLCEQKQLQTVREVLLAFSFTVSPSNLFITESKTKI